MKKLLNFTELIPRLKRGIQRQEQPTRIDLHQSFNKRDVAETYKLYKKIYLDGNINLLKDEDHSTVLSYLTEHIHPHLAFTFSFYIAQNINTVRMRDHHNFMTIYLRANEHDKLVFLF